MPNIQECLKQHALLHSLSGIGLGFIIVALVPSLIANALMLGFGLVVVAVVGEFVVNKK